ncbi:MAG: LysR family transcriptional regulator [Ahrensia sp.]|nr:LysR family transcriptional regulator [Ahrensia sp.]
MELNQIKHFLNLSETLNFTEAARLSGVSQPSLTKSIRRLEQELGGALLYRDGKDTRLTALGRDLQGEFTRVDAIFEIVRELADRSIAGRSVMLTIGVATTIAPGLFSRFWAHVLEQLPMVELSLEPLLPSEGEAEVLSGKYDLCILPEAPQENFKLEIVPLVYERVKLAMAENYALVDQAQITPEQIAEEPYLDRIHCEFRSQFINHFKDRNIVMRPRIQTEREDWIQSMVANGLGISAMPEHSIIVDGIVTRSVTGLELGRHVTMVAVSGSGNPREVRQILKLAKLFDWVKPKADVV